MKNETGSIETGWMIDVLSDLQAFCIKNGLVNAARKLEETNEYLGQELGNDCADLRRRKEPEDTSCL